MGWALPVLCDVFPSRNQFAPCVIRLVDVKRLVGHQVGERDRDPIEQCVEALLRHHLVEHLGKAPIGVGERLRLDADGRGFLAMERG